MKTISAEKDGGARRRLAPPRFSRTTRISPAGILHRLLMLSGIVLISSTNAWSQASPRTEQMLRRVTGSVVDRTQAPLPRALVQVRDPEGRLIASTQSNTRGEFAFDLREGEYTVTAALAGFAPLENYPLKVAASTPPLRLSMELPALEQEIIVTATKTESPMAQVGSSTTVISREQLDREGNVSVAEALRKIPGLTLVQSGGNGQLASLFLRGGESDYTKVLIDGIPINEPGGSYNFANLSAAGIDRIEIVRGPQSALFGSDAIGGVIQVFTRRGTSEGLSPSPRILVEGGTFSTFRYTAGIGGKGKRFDYAASFTRMDTDNNVVNGSFNEETIAANLGYAPSRNTEIRAIFRSEAGRAGVPGPWAFHRPESDEYYRHRDLAGGLTLTHLAKVSWTQRLAYTISDSRQLSADPSDSGSFVAEYQGRRATFTSFDYPFQTLNQTRRHRVSYQSDLTLPHGHLLTAGGDFERESGIVGDPSFSPLQAGRDNFGGYVQDQWAVKNRLFTATGVRLEHNESFGLFAAPRLSLALLLRQASPASSWGMTKIKGNFGLGIKEPTLVESFSTSPFFRGNPDLRPEKSVSFDAGFEQILGSGGSVLDIAYFENRYRDQIGFAITNLATFEGSFLNIGKTQARGIETFIRHHLGWNWEIAAAYTLLKSKVLESAVSYDPVFAKGQQLFRRPRHSGYLDVRWKPGPWMLSATGVFVGSRVDSDFSGLGLGRNAGYATLNLSASYRISDWLSCFVIGNNVLDKRYMEVLGYPALGAHFRIGLRAGL